MPWYVWLIWCAVQLAMIVWVAGISKKAGEEKSGGGEHPEKLIKLYQQIEEMLDSFEEYVGEVHGQLEEKRSELLELNRQAQVIYLQALETAKQTPPEQNADLLHEPEADAEGRRATIIKRGEAANRSKAQPLKPSRLTDKDKEALGRLATKTQRVRFLMSRGFSLEEVARELDIGKGEILLISELDRS